MRYLFYIIVVLSAAPLWVAAQPYPSFRQAGLPAQQLAEYIAGEGMGSIFNARIGPCNEPAYGIFEYKQLGIGETSCLGMNSGIALSVDFLDSTSDYPHGHLHNGYRAIFPYNEPPGGLYYGENSITLSVDYWEEVLCYSAAPYDTAWTLLPDEDIHALYNSLPAPNLHYPNTIMPEMSFKYRCGLSFDFVPQGDSIALDYIFAAMDYQGNVCTKEASIMGIFLSGPGIEGVKNIAVVPGTDIPVSVNSINNAPYDGEMLDTGAIRMSYCRNISAEAPYHEYYVHNVPNDCRLLYPGFTTKLRAKAAVNACDTYSIRIVVSAQNFDNGYRRGAAHTAATFVEQGSFISYSNLCTDSVDAIEGVSRLQGSITAYPNPFVQGFSLKLGGTIARDEVFRAELLNVQGQSLWQQQGRVMDMNPMLQGIGEGLNAGLYVLKITDGKGGVQVLKLVKQLH